MPHVAAGARMVPFAGWEMPVQYEGDRGAQGGAHGRRRLRRLAHGSVPRRGPNAHELLQSLLSNDLDKIGDGEAQYTPLTNERGGIVDDLIAYRINVITTSSSSMQATAMPPTRG